MKQSLFLLFLALFLTSERSYAEVIEIRLEGYWHEDPKCATSQDAVTEDPFYIGRRLATPKGDLLSGVGELSITKYEFGCGLKAPNATNMRNITFAASCGEENSRNSSKGKFAFEILSGDSMKVTFPSPMTSSKGPTRTLTLYRCKS